MAGRPVHDRGIGGHKGGAYWPALLALALMLAWTAPRGGALAQDAPRTMPAGQIELARLVDIAAERLKVPIEYDAAALKGTATLRLESGLTDQELWDLTNTVLASRGFTTVRTQGGQGLSVMKISDAKNFAALTGVPHEGEGTSTPEPGYTAAVLIVKHRAVKDIVESVKLVLSKDGGAVSALADSGMVLVSDLSSRVEEAKALVAALDAPSQTTLVEVETRFLTPAQLVPLVQQVVAKRTAAGAEPVKGDVLASPNTSSVLIIAPPEKVEYWKDLVTALDKREPVETATYAPKYFGVKEVAGLMEQAVREGPSGAASDDRFRVVTDELTGSLIVTATPSQHQRVRELLERLDSVSTGARRPVRIYAVRNRPVTDVLAVVQQLMEAGVLSAEIDSGLASSLSKSPTSAASALQSSPSSPTLDNSASTSPVSGTTPSPGERLRGAQRGAESERSRPGAPGSSSGGDEPLSLTADTGTNSLIAVGEPRALAQLETLLKSIDVRQPQVMLEVMLVSLTEAQGLQLGVEIEKLTNIDNTIIRLASLFGLSAGGAGARAVGDVAGFTGTALNPGDFNLVVRALQNMNHGHSLSAPQVLVNNNQQAVLSSVLQQPFAQTNASSTVATTSFGGTQDAGTTLTIRPQIAEGDHLVLQYSVALSSFVGSASNAALPPPRQQNTVQSMVTIPDGYTVVVGGLELESESKSTDQVPILGDIPLLGELFKNRNNTSSKTRFFVFIRAGVMRAASFEDLKYVSDTKASSMGVDDGFPEVEPMLIR